MGITILPSHTISLDTNIIISAFDTQNPLHTRCQELLEKINLSSPRVFTSVLVFQEFLVKVYSEGLEKDLSLYEEFITANGQFTVVDITRSVARAAAKIRGTNPSIKTPDALHLATALESKSQYFFTTDTHLPKKIGPLQIITI